MVQEGDDKMNILVTGGAGFIGSHLVDRLVEKHDVKVLDCIVDQVHHGRKPDFLNPKAEYIFSDVRDDKSYGKIFEGVEAVFHLAAEVGVGQSMYEIAKYMDANTMGTARLLDFLANGKHSIRKVVVASSMSIYGEGSYECGACGDVYPKLRDDEQLRSRDWEMKCPKCGKAVKPKPTKEDKPLNPTSVYAISKRDQEELCLTVGRVYGIPTVAMRFFNVYGPRQSLSNPYTGVAAIFSSRIKNDNPPLIFEDGLQSRDFINVKDIVKSCLLVMESNKTNYESFNVGTGKPTAIIDIANTLSRLYGKELRPEIANRFRSGDIRHCYADISKIKGIGFEPATTIESGLKELVSWGEKQQATDMTEKAQRELMNKGLVEK